jgi:HEAT repeat protein
MALVLGAWLCAGLCTTPCAGRAGAGEEGGGQEEDPVINGKPLSELIKQLRHRVKGLQLRAARTLIDAPAELRPKMMPRMMTLLKSERENDKYVAAMVLGECGPAARAAVPDLLPMLQGTEYQRNRAAAAKALGMILRDAEPSEEVEKVAAALTRKFNEEYDKYSDVRREAVRALGVIGPAAKSCIPKLTRALTDHKEHSDEHRQVRRQAAWTCGRMGPLAAEHADRLVAMLMSEPYHVPECVEALGLIGPVNDNIAPNILTKLEGQEDTRAQEVAHPTERFRYRAFVALRRLGPAAECAVPFAKRVLANRPAANNRYGIMLATEAVRMLAAVGPEGKKALAEVEALTGYEGGGDLGAKLREEAARTAEVLKGE